MKKTQMIEISVALGLVISIIFSVVGFGNVCNDIRKNVVRLHVIANSDSIDDQNVKLLVRDALLSRGSEIFSGTVNVNNAKECLAKEKEMLIKTANEVLRKNNLKYNADIYLMEEYFETREYDDFTLPAGEYLALKVVLGEGKGRNWWCVMFPPLCIPAATQTNTDIILGKEGVEIISNPIKYEMRFKIIEIVEEIKIKLKNRTNG